jgi:class 3 adenylate cyclase
MICHSCQHENASDNTFCGACGTRLVLICDCGQRSPATNAFCGTCGRRLTREVEASASATAESGAGERRQLTVVFCDLVGSTDLAARLDPEEYGEALHAYHANADEVITRHGGYVAQHLGDGLLVYFGWPQTYDDAAERAVRAGLALVEATATVHAGGAPLAARVGLHTGAVVLSAIGAGNRQETLAVGDTPNVAARVQAASAPGQVLITAATHRLVAGLFIVEECGAHSLKGVPRPVELYRVVEPSGVRGRLQAAAARGFTPFVNRSEERALLRSRVERVCDGEGQVVLLTGEAGIGKSRLARVLREELADTPHTWLETGGSPHFANTPFYAVTELLRHRSPWDDDNPAARSKGLADALRRAGLDPAEALPLVGPLLDVAVPEEYRPAVVAPEMARKRLLATLAAWLFGMARLQPLVVLVEDLHWVDPSTLELVHLLVEQVATAPVLLLGTARPQFQAPWPSRAHYTQLTLSRLPRRHVRDMVLGVAAQATLLAEVIDELAVRTDGVPLFVEELTKAVVEAGAAAVTREIPATLADSLMARLDRLGAAAKEVAQVGAVCGREFSFALVQAVHPLAAGELEAALAKLVDAELLHARGLAPEATYTFKHALVQDAAYESLLRSRRRSLHAQVAATLRERCAGLVAEHPELLAHHHEAAAELEPAVAAWHLAGERALERGAPFEAEHHLTRSLEVLARLPEGAPRDSREFSLQLALGMARLSVKGYSAPEAAATFNRAVEIGERLAEPEQLVSLLGGIFLSTLTRDGPAIARPLGERLLAAAERLENGLARALGRFAVGLLDMYAGELTRAREHFVAALALHADDPRGPVLIDLRIGVQTHLADLAWQLGCADQARAYLRDALERAARSSRPMDREFAAHYAAVVFALLRDPGQAAAHADLADQTAQPNPMCAAVVKIIRGWCLAQAGDAAQGVETVRGGIDDLVATGHRLSLERYHSLLADACLAAGNLDAAARALAAGEQASFDQRIDRPGTLARRAELAAAGGGAAAAIEAAFADALAAARAAAAKSYELRIAMGYARWLRARGRSADAHALLAPVSADFGEGFDTRDLCEARDLLAALAGEALPTAATTGWPTPATGEKGERACSSS